MISLGKILSRDCKTSKENLQRENFVLTQKPQTRLVVYRVARIWQLIQVTSLYVETETEDFILTNLDKKNNKDSLDIAFGIGEKISFKVYQYQHEVYILKK